jgi:hypothetical protein
MSSLVLWFAGPSKRKRGRDAPMRNLAPLVAMPPKLRHDHHAATVRRSGTLDPCSYTAVWCHSCVGGWVGADEVS